jgi:hypothetical protein
VITCFNDIFLMHQRVLDMRFNPHTMQSGPSVDRILDKSLVMFPKLASMDVAMGVEFLLPTPKDVGAVLASPHAI